MLTPQQVQALLDGCEHLRDRLLLAVLYDTGMRIGEALGLRHNDIAAAEREITVVRRDNDNGARAKSIIDRTVPVSAELVRLYADYLHAEYGDLDSDYVFVNLWGRPLGRPWTYAAVYDLVLPIAAPHRGGVRSALDTAHRSDENAARRHQPRGRRQAARSLQRDRHRHHLWASHRRRCSRGDGEGGLVRQPAGGLVTAPAADGPQSLLARLMAVVRAEFRSQTLIFEPDDPVFGGGPAE